MIRDLTLIPFLDETSGTALRVELARVGNVHKQTMRGDDNQDFETIVEVVS